MKTNLKITIIVIALLFVWINTEQVTISSWSRPRIGDDIYSPQEVEQSVYNALVNAQCDPKCHSSILEYVKNESVYESRIAKIRPNSPLVPYEELFLQYVPDAQQAYLLMAISGIESNFGINAHYYNAVGIYNSKNKSFNWGWTRYEQAIPEYYKLIGSYLKKWDGTKKGLQETFIGKGKYCQSACSGWVNTVWDFYLNLKINEN